MFMMTPKRHCNAAGKLATKTSVPGIITCVYPNKEDEKKQIKSHLRCTERYLATQHCPASPILSLHLALSTAFDTADTRSTWKKGRSMPKTGAYLPRQAPSHAPACPSSQTCRRWPATDPGVAVPLLDKRSPNPSSQSARSSTLLTRVVASAMSAHS